MPKASTVETISHSVPSISSAAVHYRRRQLPDRVSVNVYKLLNGKQAMEYKTNYYILLIVHSYLNTKYRVAIIRALKT